MLVAEEIKELRNWYTQWLNPIKLSHTNVTPGVIYRFKKKDMIKILSIITELLEGSKDNYTDEDEEKGELPLLFSYLVFAPYTEDMRDSEWLNREEYEERLNAISEKLPLDEEMLDCEKDHETFFRYGLSCPVCGQSPSK